ncbi:MAG: carboxypeptidase [Bdellovibrionaceae bacterium]|nr:carboxypeptidase [Pseudobdellovibrionaceae bacterium]
MLESILSLFLLQAPESIAASASRYDNIVVQMEQLAKSNSAQVQMFTLGTNDQGLPIKGLKIGNGATNSLVVATHHGNEYGSTEVGIAFANYLAKAPIKDQTVWVIPVLNISGYNTNLREEKNAKESLDANRDYPGPCVYNKTFQLRSTSSLAQFLVDKNIVISATLHTYSAMVVYPWGISTHDLSTPYDNDYKKLVSAATVESGYQTGNNTELLYPADGTFEDYAYWKHGIWSLLFELGFSHNPDPQAVLNMVNSNNPGIKRFLEAAPKQRVTAHDFKGKCELYKSRQRIFLE